MSVKVIYATVVTHDLSDDPLIIEVHKSNGINFETALVPGNAFGLDEFNLAKGPGGGDKLLLTYNNDTKVIALKEGTELILASNYFPHA